jgi:hypothetical protein
MKLFRNIALTVALIFAGQAFAAPQAATKSVVKHDAAYKAPTDVQYKAPAPVKAESKSVKKANVHVTHRYALAYFNPGTAPGSVKDFWTYEFHNLVPDVSINKLLSDTYTTKSADSQYYVGLITGPGAAGCASGDTMASHAGWSENTTYSNTTRVVWCPGSGTISSNACTGMGAVSGKSTSNSTAPAVFNINGTATIGGSFMVSGSAGTADTKSGTGGTLRSCGAFSSGDKAVSNGGTLTVTITATGS